LETHCAERLCIFDAEVVWLGSNGVADFDALHSRVNDGRATAFDLLMLKGDDLRRKAFIQRKAMLQTVLPNTRNGI